MKLDVLIDYLDDYLDIGIFQDDLLNGLEVGSLTDEVENISLAVRLNEKVIERAGENESDLLIVHHGLFEAGDAKPIVGDKYELLKGLMRAELNLYTCHLPLDAHPEVGNNITLARMIEIEDVVPFGFYRGGPIGFRGHFARDILLDDLIERINKGLNTESKLIRSEGKDTVKTAAVVSGRGAFALAEAIEYDIDLLITGEPSQGTYHPAQQGGVSLLFAGDYATERVGLEALANKLSDEFNLNVNFIDIE